MHGDVFDVRLVAAAIILVGVLDASLRRRWSTRSRRLVSVAGITLAALLVWSALPIGLPGEGGVQRVRPLGDAGAAVVVTRSAPESESTLRLHLETDGWTPRSLLFVTVCAGLDPERAYPVTAARRACDERQVVVLRVDAAGGARGAAEFKLPARTADGPIPCEQAAPCQVTVVDYYRGVWEVTAVPRS